MVTNSREPLLEHGKIGATKVTCSRAWLMRGGKLFVALVGLLPAAMRCNAEEVSVIPDIRCVVVGLRLSESRNATQQNSGMMLMLYYMGRLDGESPTAEVEDLLVQEVGKMSAVDLDKEARRCGAVLERKGNQITKIGENMIKRGQEMLQTPAAPRT